MVLADFFTARVGDDVYARRPELAAAEDGVLTDSEFASDKRFHGDALGDEVAPEDLRVDFHAMAGGEGGEGFVRDEGDVGVPLDDAGVEAFAGGVVVTSEAFPGEWPRCARAGARVLSFRGR